MDTLSVKYQVIWFDFNTADSTYTPRQLRKAGLVVRQGKETTYSLVWPGGKTEPPALVHPPYTTRANRAGVKGKPPKRAEPWDAATAAAMQGWQDSTVDALMAETQAKTQAILAHVQTPAGT